MPPSAESAVRTYLTALKDPSALRDEEQLEALRQRLESTDDALERIKIRQQLMELQQPSLDQHEDAFVNHAKEWAQRNGVTGDAFAQEGVPPAVLRRAGFRVARGPGRTGRERSTRAPRSRVTSEEVRAAMPKSAFTIKSLQEKTGASPAVVRKVVHEALEEGRITDVGAEERQGGPGRAARLYKRVK